MKGFDNMKNITLTEGLLIIHSLEARIKHKTEMMVLFNSKTDVYLINSYREDIVKLNGIISKMESTLNI